MWPVGHLASGILVQRIRDNDYETKTTFALLVGVVFPDFVDKPFGALKILPAYHTVAHSLLTGTLIALLAHLFGEKEGVLQNFAVGYLLHIAGDLLLTLGKWDQPTFFFWPILRPENTVSRPITEYILDYIKSIFFIFEIVLVTLALLPWGKKLIHTLKQSR